MILILILVKKICPFQSGKQKIAALIERICKAYYGTLVSRDELAVESQRQRCQIYRDTQRILTASATHSKTFADFRGKHVGQDIVIVGAGPSASKYMPIAGAVHIALNRAITLPIEFTYLFAIDKVGVEKFYDAIAAADCIKFIGDQNLGAKYQIPESQISRMKGKVLRYMTDADICRIPGGGGSRFTKDIESIALGNFNSVSLQAMQFALYTHPRRIYLVGIDCSSAGHFGTNDKVEMGQAMLARGEILNQWADDTMRFWQELKEFATTYYPDVEIVSVNPVGLRGMFSDIDQ